MIMDRKTSNLNQPFFVEKRDCFIIPYLYILCFYYCLGR
jgi:hypothetical protein